jgi:hypothetical protein
MISKSTSLHAWHLGFAAVVPFLCVALASCNSDVSGPSDSANIRPYLTARAAASLGADGNFLLSAPAVPAAFPAIDSLKAESLAVALARGVSTEIGLWKFVEAQHGGPVNASRLQLVNRVEYMDSPYEPLSTDAPGSLRRMTSPQYVVRLKENGIPSVGLAISIYDTELFIKDGNVSFPTNYGNEFEIFGMPAAGYERPLGPEQAVQVAATQTGAKVDAVPTLLKPHNDFSVEFARWKIVLDRPVVFQSIATSTRYTEQTIYVGATLRDSIPGITRPKALFVPLPVQPTVDTMIISPNKLYKIRPGFPIRFDEVIAVK